MLILPLHKKPTAANFPVVTLLLVLANLFVFLFLQAGDAGVQQRAFDYWRSSGLDRIEVPLYAAHLEARGEIELAAALAATDESERSALVFPAIQGDPQFVPSIERRTALPSSDPSYASWSERRDELDRQWRSAFTSRYLLEFDSFDPKRLFASMFLHADLSHLIGNMLFLVLLGLLVEGAVGHGAFLALYLLGGLGGSLLSLVRHYGDPGGALGASGAIAALMGAYCVIWGLRHVRFFYWIVFVFDYVKAPALVLLPLWLGWELANLWLNTESNVGFDAHAGGIMAGVLLAFVARRLGFERREFLEEDEKRDAEAELRERAFAAFGKLELARARPLLAELATLKPDDLATLAALYQAWRAEPARAELHEAATRALRHGSPKLADVVRLRTLAQDYLATPAPRIAEVLAFARRTAGIGPGRDAEALLAAIASKAPSLEGLADAWFELALTLRDRDAAAAKRLLEAVAQRHPGTKPAEKAAFLLAN